MTDKIVPGLRRVAIFRVNGISIVADSIDHAITLYRQYREGIERPDLQCYRGNEELDIKEAKYIQKVWLPE